MFGSERANLSAFVPILQILQCGSCFYCGRALQRTGVAVDHFIPWSRYPVDLGHNFVLAHGACNTAKADALAAIRHLERWWLRNEDHAVALREAFGERRVLHDAATSRLVLEELLAALGNPLVAHDARALLLASTEEIERAQWEEEEVGRLATSTPDLTEVEALVKARRGQGVFRQNVARVEPRCRITRVANPTYLIASHIKPWRHASNEERLSGENGLLLAAQADLQVRQDHGAAPSAPSPPRPRAGATGEVRLGAYSCLRARMIIVS
jgi:hypothetical protein